MNSFESLKCFIRMNTTTSRSIFCYKFIGDCTNLSRILRQRISKVEMIKLDCKGIIDGFAVCIKYFLQKWNMKRTKNMK